MRTQAEVLQSGDGTAAAALAAKLIKPLKNNFVERPWGGTRMRAFKGLCDLPEQLQYTGAGLGEAFEIAAYDSDEEARAYPSRIRCEDGSLLSLPALLARHGPALLGEAFVRRYGACFPLLPKTLDIKELLSVQAHPPGNTEAYIIIDAEPGASIRLGFAENIDAALFEAELEQGRREQRALVAALAEGASPSALQAALAPWLADRAAVVGAVEQGVRPLLAQRRGWSEARVLLERLKRLYWRVLDATNPIPVAAGQVIHNATPARLLAGTTQEPSAEVHALGNPERREILALEIRRPGPTLRAWDNVRFPVRTVDVRAAIEALNLMRTGPEEFIVEPEPVPGRPGVLRSIASPYFSLEHLRPPPAGEVAVPREPPHCLHALAGAVRVLGLDGRDLGSLERGESAIVPAGVGAYRVAADGPGVEIVKVSLPL